MTAEISRTDRPAQPIPTDERSRAEPSNVLAHPSVAATLAMGTSTTTAVDAPAAEPAEPSPPVQQIRLRAHRGVLVARSPRRRRPARLVPAAGRVTPAATMVAAPDTHAELRNWVKDNATLLSNATLLISIATLALNLLPGTGFVEPYIQALLFGAAFLLLIELHHQWPDDLQLHLLRRTAIPTSHSWRMTGFAFVLQVATVLFAVWAVLTSPLILFPLTAIAVVVGFRRWYFRRFGSSALGKVIGIVSLLAVLLISEALMVITWAVVTGEPVTVEFFFDERSSYELNRR